MAPVAPAVFVPKPKPVLVAPVAALLPKIEVVGAVGLAAPKIPAEDVLVCPKPPAAGVEVAPKPKPVLVLVVGAVAPNENVVAGLLAAAPNPPAVFVAVLPKPKPVFVVAAGFWPKPNPPVAVLFCCPKAPVAVLFC